MPTKEEVDQVFARLVTNGLEFLEQSTSELANAPGFSVAHFATGLELLLKARLFSEHWSLIFTDPHSCSWTSVTNGDLHTIQASSLCGAITSSTGTPLRDESRVFKNVFDHRNQVLHWTPPGALADVAAEQCRAWYRLHRLLTISWRAEFVAFAARINAVDQSLLAHRAYLSARFEAQSGPLQGARAAGRLVDCPACGFASGVLVDPGLAISDLSCDVCRTAGPAGKFECGRWHLLDCLPVECPCTRTHGREELLDALDPRPRMSPKEELTYQETRWHCGECLDFAPTVVAVGEGFRCVACGGAFVSGQLSFCECCNEPWAGYDTEHSYYTGCEWCDGPDHR